MTASDIYANVGSAAERAALLFVYGGQALVRVLSNLAASGRSGGQAAPENDDGGETVAQDPSSPVLGLDGDWDSKSAARRRYVFD